MRVELRLKRILLEHELLEPGIFNRLATDLGCHRHTISKLYYNKLQYIPVPVLERLCEWLIKRGVPAATLPQALFGTAPAGLWEAVSANGTVRIYLAEHHQTNVQAITRRWIARRDSALSSQIIHTLTEVSGREKHHDKKVTIDLDYVPYRFAVPTGTENKSAVSQYFDEDKEMAIRKYQDRAPCSRLYIGSQRVNYLVELFMAELFDCVPFTPFTGRVPVYLKYRSFDADLHSCFGGQARPSQTDIGDEPGVYYRTPEQKWEHFPWAEGTNDAGVVVVLQDKSANIVDMVVLGYSGTGTAAMSGFLSTRVNELWPPTYELSDNRAIGIHVCGFSFKGGRQTDEDDADRVASDIRHVSIPSDVLERALLRKPRPSGP